MIDNQRGLLEILKYTKIIIKITLDLYAVNHFSVSFRLVFYFYVSFDLLLLKNGLVRYLPLYTYKSLDSCVLNVLNKEPDCQQQTH